MTRAIRFTETGGPEVLRLERIDPPPPGPGEIRLRQTAIAVNFIDTYHRSGLYPVKLPSGVGLEAVGIVEAIGRICERFDDDYWLVRDREGGFPSDFHQAFAKDGWQ